MQTVFEKEVQVLNDLVIQDLRERIINNLIETLVRDFRRDAEEIVKKEIMQLSIETIQMYRNIMNHKDNVDVRCFWTNTSNGAEKNGEINI